jgi:endogenous inhibitor of DNA gyrase (YacG/DUF329 family)
MNQTTCASCGATVNKYPSQIRERNFCSRACLGVYRSTHLVGEKAAHWKGGEKKDRNRTLIYKPDHPNADSRGYVYRYRLVAEEMLGRFLERWEIVHHRDGDPGNDEPDNLVVTSQSEHCRVYDARKPRKAK